MGNPIADAIEGFFKGVSSPVAETIQKGMDQKMQAQQIAGDIEKQLGDLKSKLIDFVDKTNQGQVEINKIEAQSTSLFKSGWRPFAGWGFGFLSMAMIVTAMLHVYFPEKILELPMSIFAIVFGTWSSLAGIRQVDKWILNGKLPDGKKK